MSGDKKKRYLQELEALARGQSIDLDLPSVEADNFTELGRQSDAHVISGSGYNNLAAQGDLQESLSPTYLQVNNQVCGGSNIPGTLPESARALPIIRESSDQHQGGMGQLDGNHVTPSTIDSSLGAFSEDIFTWPLDGVDQNIVGIEENIAPLPNLPRDMHPNTTSGTKSVPFIPHRRIDSQLSEDTTNRRFTLQEILMAGLQTLSKTEAQPMKGALTRDLENEARRILASRTASDDFHLPDIRMNTIQLTAMSFVAACISNAAMLGLSPAELMNKQSQSPFYHADISNEAAKTACSKDFIHLKPQLRPSATQLLHPHHPYFDILPFPAFRNCAIQLLQVQPSPFDPDELCQDLKNDGLICWGSTEKDGRPSTGSGVPWDIRSWEMQSWFHKKWWMLIGGTDGEMYQQTQWWNEMKDGRGLI